MSFYSAPTTGITNVFNNTNFSDETSSDNNNDVDLTGYLQRSGGHMTGILSVNDILFQDASQQSSAFTTEQKQQLTQNTSDILSLNSSHANQNTQITSNTGNIQTMIPKLNTAELNIDNNTTSINNNTNDIVDIKVKTDTIDSVTSTMINTRRQLHFQNPSTGNTIGYIGSVGDALYIGCSDSKPFVINPNRGYIQHYCSVTTFGDNNGPGKLILHNLGTNTGEIHINNEIQKHAYTDEDHAKLTNLSNQTIAIQNNANDISTLDSRVTNLHNQGISNLFMISLNHNDIAGNGSQNFTNGQEITYTHDFNIGYLLYHTYGMTNDFYTNGTWRSNSTWEISANISFNGNTSYIYRLNTGFRNLNIHDSNIESDTTSSLIDGGFSSVGTGSSFYKNFRYNTGTNYIKATSGGSHLYGNYILFLRTTYHIKAANSGDIHLKGQLNIRKLDNI